MTKILLCDCSILTEQETYEKAYRLVSAFRQKKADACKAKMDRARCIGAGLLLREAFFSCLRESNAVPAAKEPIQVLEYETDALLDAKRGELQERYLALTECADAHGRSHWEGEGDLWEDAFLLPYVSISHSGALAAVALSDQPVGLDIQKKRTFTEGMIRRVLAPAELAAYERIRQSASGPVREKNAPKEKSRQEEKRLQADEAYLLSVWCQKEAAAKLDGRGIFAMLSELSEDGWKETARIHTDELSIREGYAGAVAGRCAE